jgi:hypothetical protein
MATSCCCGPHCRPTCAATRGRWPPPTTGQGSALRRFIGGQVFRALLIDRQARRDAPDPVQAMAARLQAGDSLILFPEGTRNTGDEVLLPFKSGLYHLAHACPEVRLVPVWIREPEARAAQGQLLPVPLACSVEFGRHAGPAARRKPGRLPGAGTCRRAGPASGWG